ncbi:MAG: alpha/beta hydrolase, partial [Gemmataceae bacterium]|nr:alpha/beta hydrolase [Gemmataceae bacterium]
GRTISRMLVELVRVPTPDGCTLDAALNRAEPASTANVGLDAVILIHGTGGNFYSSTFFELLAANLARLGVAALRANTRGHDGISTLVTAKGGIRHGAAYETVDECRHDLIGLIDWVRDNVGPRLGLLGHSLGAVKCLYAAAHQPELPIQAIVAVSPPRLSYSWFCRSARASEFLATYRQALSLVESGQGQSLMEVRMPLPLVITAAGYVEKYGPTERYNYFQLVPALRCPTLLLFGSIEVENHVAFQQAPHDLAAMAAGSSHLAVEVVPGADHFYTGVREAAWERIAAWLRR